jgi:hypothetical protein
MKKSSPIRITGGPILMKPGTDANEYGWTSIEIINKTIVNVCYEKQITYNGIVTVRNYVSLFTLNLENEITESEQQSLAEALYNGFNARYAENLCHYDRFMYSSNMYLNLLKLRLITKKKRELTKAAEEPYKQLTKEKSYKMLSKKNITKRFKMFFGK